MYRSCLCVGGNARSIMPSMQEGIGAFAGSIPQPLRCVLHHDGGRGRLRLYSMPFAKFFRICDGVVGGGGLGLSVALVDRRS